MQLKLGFRLSLYYKMTVFKNCFKILPFKKAFFFKLKQWCIELPGMLGIGPKVTLSLCALLF